jgi:hypothetical protein
VKREILIVIIVDGFALPFNPNDAFKVLIEPQDVFSITNWKHVKVILMVVVLVGGKCNVNFRFFVKSLTPIDLNRRK